MLSPSTQSSGRSALCAAIPFLFFIQKQTQQLKQKKKKNEKKRKTRGSWPTNPDTPLYWYHPLYFLTFSTTSEGTPAKGRCIDYLLPDPK